MIDQEDDQPIRELAELESPVSNRFLQLFRRKVNRRVSSVQLAYFYYAVPIAILVECLSIIVHLFSVADGKKGRSK